MTTGPLPAPGPGPGPPPGSQVAPLFTSLAEARAARFPPSERAGGAYVYARFGSTSVRRLEAKAAPVLGVGWAVVTGSGSAALDLAVSSCLAGVERSRPPVVGLTERSYVGTRRYFDRVLGKVRGTRVVSLPFVQAGDEPDAFVAALGALQPDIVVCESVTNPFMSCADVATMALTCRDAGAAIIVDSTMTPPPNVSPLVAGADLVVHSATKYLGGRNDLMAGIVAGDGDDRRGVCEEYRRLVGATLDDASADRLLFHLDDLESRFNTQSANAAASRAFLEAHPGVRRVWASGRDHAPHGVAAVVTFQLETPGGDSRGACDAFVKGVSPAIPLSFSFGSVVSTVTPLDLLDPAYDGDALFRLSCGTEPWPAIREPLAAGLAAIDG